MLIKQNNITYICFEDIVSVPVSPVLFDMSSLGKGRIKNIINTIFSVYISLFKCVHAQWLGYFNKLAKTHLLKKSSTFSLCFFILLYKGSLGFSKFSNNI